MPVARVTKEAKVSTRNDFTKVDATLTLVLDGTEMPGTGVIGAALDEAFELVQKAIKESYAVAPRI